MYCCDGSGVSLGDDMEKACLKPFVKLSLDQRTSPPHPPRDNSVRNYSPILHMQELRLTEEQNEEPELIVTLLARTNDGLYKKHE